MERPSQIDTRRQQPSRVARAPSARIVRVNSNASRRSRSAGGVDFRSPGQWLSHFASFDLPPVPEWDECVVHDWLLAVGWDGRVARQWRDEFVYGSILMEAVGLSVPGEQDGGPPPVVITPGDASASNGVGSIGARRNSDTGGSADVGGRDGAGGIAAEEYISAEDLSTLRASLRLALWSCEQVCDQHSRCVWYRSRLQGAAQPCTLCHRAPHHRHVVASGLCTATQVITWAMNEGNLPDTTVRAIEARRVSGALVWFLDDDDASAHYLHLHPVSADEVVNAVAKLKRALTRNDSNADMEPAGALRTTAMPERGRGIPWRGLI